MRQERQVELLERVAASGAHFAGLHGEHSMVNPATAYTDPERFATELRVLFRNGPTLLGLSCEMPEPGDYLSTTVDGIPIVAVRQADGSLRAMVNACRHRGAPLVTDRAGNVGRSIVCGYHGWTYDPDGRLARPTAVGRGVRRRDDQLRPAPGGRRREVRPGVRPRRVGRADRRRRGARRRRRTTSARSASTATPTSRPARTCGT